MSRWGTAESRRAQRVGLAQKRYDDMRREVFGIEPDGSKPRRALREAVWSPRADVQPRRAAVKDEYEVVTGEAV